MTRDQVSMVLYSETVKLILPISNSPPPFFLHSNVKNSILEYHTHVTRDQVSMVFYSGTVKLILPISNSPPSLLSSFEHQEQHFRIPYPCDKGSSEHGFVLWNSQANFTYFQFPPPPPLFLHSNVKNSILEYHTHVTRDQVSMVLYSVRSHRSSLFRRRAYPERLVSAIPERSTRVYCLLMSNLRPSVSLSCFIGHPFATWQAPLCRYFTRSDFASRHYKNLWK